MEPNKFSRRSMFAIGAGAVVACASPVWAASSAQAEALVGKLVDDINDVIASGMSERQMIARFEQIFIRYADVPTIARYAMGRDSRAASAAQMKRFTNEFTAYLARKYGKQFRKFIGGKIEMQGSRAVKSYYEVSTLAKLKGEAPFEVQFLVTDRSGDLLFFNMFIEGINMLLAERSEIGALLDRNGGNIDTMIKDLAKIA